MLKYNLCLIKRGNAILLLNRENPQWMGRWNGIGGKLETNEQPREAMLREIQEETNITSISLEFKGFLTWSHLHNTNIGGLYLYLGYVPNDYFYPTPQGTAEGILDWKDIDWILHPHNLGVPTNLLSCLRGALEDTRCFDYHSVFDETDFVHQEIITEISPDLEGDSQLRHVYLQQYFMNLRKVTS